MISLGSRSIRVEIAKLSCTAKWHDQLLFSTQKNRRFYPLRSRVPYLLALRISALNWCVRTLPTSRHTMPGSPRRRSYTTRKVKLRARTCISEKSYFPSSIERSLSHFLLAEETSRSVLRRNCSDNKCRPRVRVFMNDYTSQEARSSNIWLNQMRVYWIPPLPFITCL